MAQTKITTPVAMYANHQAPIHCGCLEVKLAPSGYCINKVYMLVKESIMFSSENHFKYYLCRN